jgi:hypothetical protein
VRRIYSILALPFALGHHMEALHGGARCHLFARQFTAGVRIVDRERREKGPAVAVGRVQRGLEGEGGDGYTPRF